jgi:hypothetical protein
MKKLFAWAQKCLTPYLGNQLGKPQIVFCQLIAANNLHVRTNLKKLNSQISRNLKGIFQTFDPLFSVSTPQGQIKFNWSMGNYNLYRNTKLEQTWRNKKKVIHTFPKKCKKKL